MQRVTQRHELSKCPWKNDANRRATNLPFVRGKKTSICEAVKCNQMRSACILPFKVKESCPEIVANTGIINENTF